MKSKEIEIDLSKVTNADELHLVLINKFYFPQFYGKNINALIDCLSSLRFPEDQMTGVTLKDDETLVLVIKGFSNLDSSLSIGFVAAIEAVNKREFNRGKIPSIYISFC